MTRSSSDPGPVLVVEDEPRDAALIHSALRAAGADVRIDVLGDGAETLALLEEDEARALPSLILLDLKLPGTSGEEVLRRIKSDVRLRSIPVVVLSSSRDPGAIRRCYDLHANAYVVKPDDLDGYLSLAASIRDFWLAEVRRP